MNEPYSPIDTESLGIVYIKDNYDSVDWGIDNKKDLYLKKQALIKAVAFEIRKRELRIKNKQRKRLPLW